MIRWFLRQKESTQERILAVLAGVLALVLFVGVFIVTIPPQMDTSKMDKRSYYVSPGETLWGIAEKHCPDGVDYRDWIAAVRDLNDLDGGQIYAGQIIYIWTE